ncbi:hypothetical protein Tco_0523866 [Tanacetum coccineum]
MLAEYNILEKRKWKSLAEEKDCLLEARDKEIEELKSQLLKATEEFVEVAQLRAQVSGLEASENSLRGEVASTKEHNVLLEQECDSLNLRFPREFPSSNLLNNVAGRRWFTNSLDETLVVRDLRDLNYPLLHELIQSEENAITMDIWIFSAWMMPCEHSEGWKKMKRNLIERPPLLEERIFSIDDPLSAEALIEPPVEVPATNVLSTVVIVPHSDPSVSVRN